MDERARTLFVTPGAVFAEPLRRLFDITLSLFGFAALFPVLLVAATAIRLSSRGPVLYGHVRVGRNGTEFTCWKLRTMREDADASRSNAAAADVIARHEKPAHDPRITSVGCWLRRASLDEVPQLWNVLRGEMSLVGPRPMTREELAILYGHQAALVTSVLPGLTGLWQISGRSLLSSEERVRCDVRYVHTRSLRGDFLILLRTPAAVLSARGAR